jgi:DNA-binding transcriptional regulator GbsR (MarR family)
MRPDAVKQAFIDDFGTGYQMFGLSRLMGHIVGLMLCEDEPQSLDAITEKLSVSKGPVSQIARRLSDHRLLRKVWVPGSRRDHYQAVPDIFGQAFANHAAKQAQNLVLARKYRQLLAAADQPPEPLRQRVEEMTAFYELMREYHDAFMDAWQARREALGAEASATRESP